MTLFTIGYEGATVEGLVSALQAAGVRTLADVRAVPLSRKPGFSKKSLGARLAEAGIGYRHLQRLGTPPDGREAARKGNHAGLERIYLSHLEASDAQAQLAELAELARTEPVALLCFERAPADCHRSILANQPGLRELERVDLFAD